tara:strand:+ start:928 stop:1062 length:135 start_codon:yes stop_codon:yes gene_type:complete
MFKLKEKYNTPEYIFADINAVSEEEQQIIKDNYMDIIGKYFDLI